MVEEFRYRLSDLDFSKGELDVLLGFTSGEAPAPFDAYVDEVFEFASTLTEFRAAIRIVDAIDLDRKRGVLAIGSKEFAIGKTIAAELSGSEKIAFFVCSAGRSISDRSVHLLKGEDPALGFVYDTMGSAIAECAGDKMQSWLRDEMSKSGMMITNRFSPGYCHWEVAGQQQLFSMFHDAPAGVTLSPSSLMYPIKSISGIIGIGPEVRFRNHPCSLCFSENCIYRNIRERNNR